MSSTPSGRPSISMSVTKKSSSTTNSSMSTSTMDTKRATSNEAIPFVDEPLIQKKSSSGFNYQSLEETSPVNVPKIRVKPPVRSHSSNNAELSYHLQQLRNIGKRKPTINEHEHDHHYDERIQLTSSNLKVECNENGIDTTIHTSMELQTIESAMDVPISWKPAVSHANPPRDSWDHKIEFLLAVIGYAVDLGAHDFIVIKRNEQ
jgi:hypothetical protein